MTLSVTGQGENDFEFLSIDRPDVSNLPITVRQGHYQFEIGYESGRNSFVNESIPNFLMRTGLSTKVELRVGFTSLSRDSAESTGTYKVWQTTASVKYRFLEERNGWPSVAIQPEVTFPVSEGTLTRDQINCSVLLLFNNTVHEKVFVNYNAGVLWSNAQSTTDYLVSISTSFAHTHRLGYFLECFSIFNQHDFPVSIDGGVTFLLFPRVQLDVYLGNKQEAGVRSWYGGSGVGFRIDTDNLKKQSFKKTGIHH